MVLDFVGEQAGEEPAHASNVVCFDLFGDAITEFCLITREGAGSLMFLVLAFLAGNCDGEGATGELTRSKVCIGSGVVDLAKGESRTAGDV